MRMTALDSTWLFLSLVPSGIGVGMFVYGKKQGRLPQLLAGLALMVYPYVASTVTALIVDGLLILSGFWLALRLGW
jgi:hypothetical protein